MPLTLTHVHPDAVQHSFIPRVPDCEGYKEDCRLDGGPLPVV